MERYAARSAERFPFLAPDRLKDAKGVRFGKPGYNPRTLMLPPNWFKTSKVLSDPLHRTPVGNAFLHLLHLLSTGVRATYQALFFWFVQCRFPQGSNNGGNSRCDLSAMQFWQMCCWCACVNTSRE